MTPDATSKNLYLGIKGSDDNPDAGNVIKDVEKGDNAPETSLVTPVEELADIFLTPEEKEQVEQGEKIKIIRNVADGRPGGFGRRS